MLFVHRGSDGGEQVLLGRRRHRPHRGSFSIPGGGMDPSDDGSYLRWARRELGEELPGIDEALLPARPPDLLVPIVLPGMFRWVTLVYVVPDAPPVAACLTGSPREFDAGTVRWYPVNAPPRPLHLGVRWALWRAHRRLALGPHALG